MATTFYEENKNMDKIFDQAKDKNVAALIIYAKSTADNKAYVDSKCKIQFKTSDLKDAFLKRALVCVGTDYFVPISYTESENIGTVVYAKAGTTTGTAATVALAAAAG